MVEFMVLVGSTLAALASVAVLIAKRHLTKRERRLQAEMQRTFAELMRRRGREATLYAELIRLASELEATSDSRRTSEDITMILKNFAALAQIEAEISSVRAEYVKRLTTPAIQWELFTLTSEPRPVPRKENETITGAV